MAQPDISSILAALAAASQAPTPSQPPPAQAPPPGVPQGYPGAPSNGPPPGMPGGVPGYPMPSSSGSFDLGNLKPSSSGSLNLHDIQPSSTGSMPMNVQDTINRAKSRAAEMSSNTYQGPPKPDPRMAGRQSYRPRSRSNSPRRSSYDDYNPYRDERRELRRNNGYHRDRSRSRSPPRGGRDAFTPPTRNYTRDRSPRRDDTETIPIDASVVGLVIGRQGENLRRIERETQTRIQFITGPDQTGPRRQCRIQGPPHSRQDATREIHRIIEENRIQKEMSRMGGSGNMGGMSSMGSMSSADSRHAKQANQPALREGENSTQIMVPDKTVGLIIGRGGETIRDLQERSGCHINILGENKSVNGLRPVNLIGNNQSAAFAKELIMEIVESDTRNGGQGQAAHEPPRGPPRDQYPPMDSGKLSETILVPSEAVGMIIGKGGETIKEMQNTTACKINVSQPSGPDRDREIQLVGPRHAIEAAKRAIYDKVDAVAQRDGKSANRGGGGRRSDDRYGGDRYSQSQPSYSPAQQPPAQMPGSMPTMGAPPAASAGGEDLYAPYGGYQNYLALWWAAMAQQGGSAAQPGAPPGGQPGAPGA